MSVSAARYLRLAAGRGQGEGPQRRRPGLHANKCQSGEVCPRVDASQPGTLTGDTTFRTPVQHSAITNTTNTSATLPNHHHLAPTTANNYATLHLHHHRHHHTINTQINNMQFICIPITTGPTECSCSEGFIVQAARVLMSAVVNHVIDLQCFCAILLIKIFNLFILRLLHCGS